MIKKSFFGYLKQSVDEAPLPADADPHGGNVYAMADSLGMNERDILDFSASINPLGVPKKAAKVIRDSIESLRNYPDTSSRDLTLAIAEDLGVNPDSIICGNGSTELIYLLVRALKPEKVLIPAPTFSEYERAVEVYRKTLHNDHLSSLKAGDPGSVRNRPVEVKHFMLKHEDNFDLNHREFISAMASGEDTGFQPDSPALNSVDLSFVCNPNNPTGRLIRKEDLLRMANAAKKLKSYLVVDEAFIDFVHNASIVEEVADNPYLIVLRSLTKFYALSGLRIGYGVFPKAVAERLRELKEPWSVNTLAQRAGTAALKDRSYRLETFGQMVLEKRSLEKSFSYLGIEFIPSAVNYYLIRSEFAEEIVLELRKEGILLRECKNFIGLDSSWLRIAVKSSKDNLRLLKELTKWHRG